jgi:hypothetical protein
LRRLEDEVDGQDDPDAAAEFAAEYIEPIVKALAFLHQIADGETTQEKP